MGRQDNLYGDFYLVYRNIYGAGLETGLISNVRNNVSFRLLDVNLGQVAIYVK